LTKNLWHSCGQATLDDWRHRMGPRARALYERFEELISRCGEYHVAPAKTRIAFLARVRFAGISSLSEGGMTCSLALPRPLRSGRFAKVDEVVPGWWVKPPADHRSEGARRRGALLVATELPSDGAAGAAGEEGSQMTTPRMPWRSSATWGRCPARPEILCDYYGFPKHFYDVPSAPEGRGQLTARRTGVRASLGFRAGPAYLETMTRSPRFIPLNAVLRGALVLALATTALGRDLAETPDPLTLSREAGEASRAGDHETAEARYRALATARPTLPSAMSGLGRSLARLGRTAEALEWLGKAADAGAGADAEAIEEAFGAEAARPEVRALLSRFRGNVTPVVRSAVAFRLPEKDLMPESVAHDPADGTFYVGGLYRRKIVAVREGVARDFVASKADGLGAVLGMKVDAARRELWANSCHGAEPPVILDAEPKRRGEAAVHRYDLRSGRLIRAYRTGSRKQPLCFNDLALTPEGDVYLSTGPDGIFRVSRARDALERVVATPGLFVNGIAASADGRRLYLADWARGVVLLDVATRSLQPLALPPAASLVGIDGLYVHGQSLIGIQNGLASGPERVLQAFLDASGSRVTCVELLERNHPAYDVPTTGVVVGQELFYVASSQLNRLDGAGRPLPADRLRESTVLRLPLREACAAGPASSTLDVEAERRALLAMHESDRLAHFTTDPALIGRSAPDVFLSVSQGRIDRISRADEAAFFEGYFRGARYAEWDDLEPPVVRLSADASMAWIVSRLRVKRQAPGPDGLPQERAFVYAGIMTYEKRDGRWVRVANVSTFE